MCVPIGLCVSRNIALSLVTTIYSSLPWHLEFGTVLHTAHDNEGLHYAYQVGLFHGRMTTGYPLDN